MSTAGTWRLSPGQERALLCVIVHGYQKVGADRIGIAKRNMEQTLHDAHIKMGVYTTIQAVTIFTAAWFSSNPGANYSDYMRWAETRISDLNLVIKAKHGKRIYNSQLAQQREVNVIS